MKTLALIAAMALSVTATAQDSAKAQAEAKLKNIKVTLDFQNAPLDAVVDYLREISDLNLFIDTKVREKMIVVSLKVNEITLKSALALILKPHNCDTMFKDGVVMLMTQEDVADKTMRMEIYDCRDILYPIQNFPGVDIDLNQAGMGVQIQDLGNEGGGEAPIEELVRAHTGGRSWEENPKAAVKLQNGLLVVKNTPEVHKQIHRILNLLRANK